MRALLCVVVLLSGCADLSERRMLKEWGLWPSTTEFWCYPRGKYDRDRKRIEGGLGCRW